MDLSVPQFPHLQDGAPFRATVRINLQSARKFRERAPVTGGAQQMSLGAGAWSPQGYSPSLNPAPPFCLPRLPLLLPSPPPLPPTRSSAGPRMSKSRAVSALKGTEFREETQAEKTTAGRGFLLARVGAESRSAPTPNRRPSAEGLGSRETSNSVKTGGARLPGRARCGCGGRGVPGRGPGLGDRQGRGNHRRSLEGVPAGTSSNGATEGAAGGKLRPPALICSAGPPEGPPERFGPKLILCLTVCLGAGRTAVRDQTTGRWFHLPQPPHLVP